MSGSEETGLPITIVNDPLSAVAAVRAWRGSAERAQKCNDSGVNLACQPVFHFLIGEDIR
jgi:hypothetical protein